MPENKVVEVVDTLKSVIDNEHWYCYGWMGDLGNIVYEGTRIPFNHVYGHCWDSSSNSYIVPEKGVYQIDFNCFSNNRNENISLTEWRLGIFKDNSMVTLINNGYGGAQLSTAVIAEPGDHISIGTYENHQISFYAGVGHNRFSIYQVFPIK